MCTYTYTYARTHAHLHAHLYAYLKSTHTHKDAHARLHAYTHTYTTNMQGRNQCDALTLSQAFTNQQQVYMPINNALTSVGTDMRVRIRVILFSMTRSKSGNYSNAFANTHAHRSRNGHSDAHYEHFASAHTRVIAGGPRACIPSTAWARHSGRVYGQWNVTC